MKHFLDLLPMLQEQWARQHHDQEPKQDSTFVDANANGDEKLLLSKES
jgi:hypothetical protein